MKQHPTHYEVSQLSEQDQQKLYAWADEHDYYADKTPFHEWFTIGRMIEFLGKEWFRFISVQNAKDLTQFLVVKNEELCDALWEAVKDVLKTYKV
jgi:hypothetical protein